ncbi:MlaA family lipoprotein [Thalassobius sp. S69A]|uniref:MlaA family lipoprotein n=1 Tax=unclassified Thalassovita TaxID=2619711 RepID=UPI003C7AFE3A
MPVQHYNIPSSVLPKLGAAVLIAALAGCTVAGPDHPQGEIFDPYEEGNRKTHEFNRALDRALVRPAAKGYVTVVPEGIAISVGNFAENLGEPSSAVNHALQGDVPGVARNVTRFVINVTLGFGGLFDAASDLGLYPDESDFGETLHVWGAPEGAYVELPALGPSTERDAAGKVVDLFTNPLSYVLPTRERNIGKVAEVAAKVGDRGRYADIVDSILYESADSYAQGRTMYLQNRRHELGMATEDTYIAPEDIDTDGF